MKRFEKTAFKLVVASVLNIILLFSNAFAQQGQAQGGFFHPDQKYRPDLPGPKQLAQDSLLVAIKNFINYVLGFLALIALIILLWGGFQMVTAAGDDSKYKKGFTILKQSGIGLVVIGLSWLIVSFFFYIVRVMVS